MGNSRQIKFRAWDVREKRYWWNVQDAYDTLRNHGTQDAEKRTDDTLTVTNFGDLLNDDDWVVEQYTGLKDKNGVEIYEGDIVKTRGIDEYSGVKDYRSDVFSSRGGEWQVRQPPSQEVKKYHCGLPVLWGGWEVEVIGNIHMNPELIK